MGQITSEVRDGIVEVIYQLDDEDIAIRAMPAPDVLQKMRVTRDPDFYVIPNFVTDFEIAHMLKLGEGEWRPSTVGRGPASSSNTADYTHNRSLTRTSESFMLNKAHDAIVANIEARVAEVAQVPLGCVELLNLLRYHPGQYFKNHHDGAFRQKTLFLYLSDVEIEGEGATYFSNLKLKFLPSRGTAILWSNNLPEGGMNPQMEHEAEPISQGMKYAVNCFINNEESGASKATNDVPETILPPVA